MIDSRYFHVDQVTTEETLILFQYMKSWLVASTTFILWDVIITLDDEVHYIWRYLLLKLDSSAQAQIHFYALYFCDKRVAIGMVLVLLVQITVMMIKIYFSAPTEGAVMVISIGPFLIILGLTITKYILGRKAGWGHIPIVSRLVKDDIVLTVILVSWGISIVLLSYFSNPIHEYIALFWVMSIVPAAVCRIVLNMQRLGVRTRLPSRSELHPQFTSVLTYGISGATNPSSLNPEPPASERCVQSELPVDPRPVGYAIN
ncbi:hypothetical protein BDQ17DRAFT_1468314 [Cyathus striatus]|nr:hypothetical protein BDQ17DRAFT_1468314 [Cyathus striatus]